MKTLLSLLFALVITPICFAQEVYVQEEEETLVVSFEYGRITEFMSFDLDDFVYNKNQNSFTLSVENEKLHLVKNLSFSLVYDLDWPPVIDFDYSFYVPDLRPFPQPVPWGILPHVQDYVEESVHFKAEISPLTLPLSDNYYLQRGQEGHFLRAYDDDGAFVHAVDSYPSYEGMVNWWAILSDGSDDLIQGGLIYGGCNQPGCSMSFSWTVLNWWMPPDVVGMRLTNELFASDLTYHSGSAYMIVNEEASKADPIAFTDVDSCDDSGKLVVPEILQECPSER